MALCLLGPIRACQGDGKDAAGHRGGECRGPDCLPPSVPWGAEAVRGRRLRVPKQGPEQCELQARTLLHNLHRQYHLRKHDPFLDTDSEHTRACELQGREALAQVVPLLAENRGLSARAEPWTIALSMVPASWVPQSWKEGPRQAGRAAFKVARISLGRRQ